MKSIDCYQENGLSGIQLIRPITAESRLVNYQMLVMTRCRPEWAIPCFLRYQGGQAQICHNLNGLRSIDCIYHTDNLNENNGQKIINELVSHLISAEDYLLPLNQISLHPSHIFLSDEVIDHIRINLVFWPVALQNPDNESVIEALRSIAVSFNMSKQFIFNLNTSYAEGGLQKLKQYLALQFDGNDQIGSKTNQIKPTSSESSCGLLLKNSFIKKLKNVTDYFHQAMQSISQWLHYQAEDDQPQDNQTVLIPADPANFRMAMISAGKPGTPEESEGLRAYILVDEFLVGRDIKSCDLCLSESGIGRQHARIIRRAGSFYITDLGSRNGTRLDGNRLMKNAETLLPDQCLLQFADQSYYFQAD